MINKISIKNNISQILALTEKNIKLNLRFKFSFIFSFIFPIVSILMPLIIMGQFLEFNAQFGPWNKDNYLFNCLKDLIFFIFLLSPFP